MGRLSKRQIAARASVAQRWPRDEHSSSGTLPLFAQGDIKKEAEVEDGNALGFNLLVSAAKDQDCYDPAAVKTEASDDNVDAQQVELNMDAGPLFHSTANYHDVKPNLEELDDETPLNAQDLIEPSPGPSFDSSALPQALPRKIFLPARTLSGKVPRILRKPLISPPVPTIRGSKGLTLGADEEMAILRQELRDLQDEMEEMSTRNEALRLRVQDAETRFNRAKIDLSHAQYLVERRDKQLVKCRQRLMCHARTKYKMKSLLEKYQKNRPRRRTFETLFSSLQGPARLQRVRIGFDALRRLAGKCEDLEAADREVLQLLDAMKETGAVPEDAEILAIAGDDADEDMDFPVEDEDGIDE